MSVLQSWRKEVEGVSEAQKESRCDRLAQLEGLAVFPRKRSCPSQDVSPW